jgi:hypothetical protein
MPLTVNEIEQLMILMGKHSISEVEVEGVKLSKTRFIPEKTEQEIKAQSINELVKRVTGVPNLATQIKQGA